MSHEKKNHSQVSIIGILLVFLGAVWVLNNLDVFEFNFSDWWPLILVAVGLVHIFGGRRLCNPSAWILIVLGGIFLLVTQDVLRWADVWKFWPVVLIIIGLSILFKRGGLRLTLTTIEDRVDETAIFWGFERKVTGKAFKGGVITAIFGGGDLDLRSAELDKDGAIIEITAIFGGVDVRLPESWAVETHITGIFGGVDNKCKNQEQKEGKRAIINATAIFGGVDIKN